MKNKEWRTFKSNPTAPESEKVFSRLSIKNKKRIEEWLYEKSILSKSEKRAGSRKRALIRLFDFAGKDWDKIVYQDYVNVASAISQSKMGVKQKNGDRYFVSRFLKDSFDDWEKKFKRFELLKNETEGDENKLKPSDLLTELEIDRMLRATPDMKKKALISVMYSTACRPEEILKARYSDVDFSKNLIYLYSAKTRKRRAVPVDLCIGHLERLKDEMGSGEEDLIFPSLRRDRKLTIAGLNFMLQEMGRRAGIKKRIFAYLFRHTRLSLLITKLSPKVYEEVSGHSLQMGMKTYAHLSQDKIIQEMREKVLGVKEISPEKKHELEHQIKSLELTMDAKVKKAVEEYIVSFQDDVHSYAKKLNEGIMVKAR